MRIESVAMICHEANRFYCSESGDDSQVSWENAPEWQKTSAITGVLFHLKMLRQGLVSKPSASHESWWSEKVAQGWVYGPVKNPDLKQHPCCVPYDELPKEQRAKDYLFAGIVHALFNSGVLQ
jgi:hypothetical protein